MARKILVDGTEEVLTDLSLESLQKAVGGYIELICTGRGRMLVNEDGRMLNLKRNSIATSIANISILGDVVLLDKKDKF